jgi:uncharacterized protein DUF3168
MTAIVDPSAELRAALVRVLRQAVTKAEGRVYGPAPANAKYPYISIGAIQVLNEKYEGLAGAQVHVTLHAWSQERSRVEIHTIGKQVVAALDDTDEELSGADLEVRICSFEDAQYLDDPDGVTAHAVITFRIFTD